MANRPPSIVNYALVVGGSAVVTTVVLLLVGSMPAPGTESACQDSVTLLKWSSGETERCDPGAEMQTKVVALGDDQRLEVICRCKPQRRLSLPTKKQEPDASL